MKRYTIVKTNGMPDWDNIPAVQIDVERVKTDHGITAQAQLCWDEAGIYVRLCAKEKNIRAELTEKLDPIWQDSCLEFFFRPTEDLHYFNIEFNANCALCLGYGTGKEDLTRLVVWNHMKLFTPEVIRTDDGWEITYIVPFEFVRRFFRDFTPKSGLKMYGNFYKCGDKTLQPHYMRWNPIPEGRSFHSPEDFGSLILE